MGLEYHILVAFLLYEAIIQHFWAITHFPHFLTFH